MMWPYYNNWGGTAACPWFGMLFVTALIVAGIMIKVLLIRGRVFMPPSSSGVQQILDERYAKGYPLTARTCCSQIDKELL